MQAKADSPDEVLVVVELPELPWCQKTVRDQLVECSPAKVAFGDPADHLQVPQATGAAFDIGLEFVGGVVISMVAIIRFCAYENNTNNESYTFCASLVSFWLGVR